MLSAAESWGSSAEDRRRPLPCDEWLPDADLVLHRAVDVEAPPDTMFRWLCQLRVAPYSYDLIDNRGRRSPRQLIPGLDRLVVGQPAMRIFHVASFERPEQLTFVHTGLFGRLAVTYAVSSRGAGSHLLARFRWTPPRSPLFRPRRAWVFGDLIMARRQLLTLKRLAERDAARKAPEAAS